MGVSNDDISGSGGALAPSGIAMAAHARRARHRKRRRRGRSAVMSRHRRRHMRMWLFLAPVVLAIMLASLILRRPIPLQAPPELPVTMEDGQ